MRPKAKLSRLTVTLLAVLAIPACAQRQAYMEPAAPTAVEQVPLQPAVMQVSSALMAER